jgi:hypothetical protein
MASVANLLVLVPLGVALSAPALAADIDVVPDRGCPASRAIEDNLASLGALRGLAQLGSAEVRLEGPRMLVAFRDRGGEHLGLRVVTAGDDCGARATLAAAVIAAFVGKWTETQLADPRPPSESAVESTSRTASPSSPSPTLGGELGVVALGLHDTDAAALGVGGRLDLVLGPWLIAGLGEASTERTRGLGSGVGAYATRRGGVGFGFRPQGGKLFWDLSLLLMVERLTLEGRDVDQGKSATTWDFVLGGDIRLGWRGRRFRPFLLLGAAYTVPPQQMALVDSDLRVTVSAFNARLGLGVAYVMSP